MTKRKYLRKLRKALGRIPESEKEELIEYYAEIIDESYERGKTTREIFATLETPEQVASDYFNANEGRMNERRRRPTRDEFFSRGRDDDDYYERPVRDEDYRKARREDRHEGRARKERSKPNIILTVVLFPIWFPIFMAVFAIALALSIVVLALVVADVVLVVAFSAAGLYCLITSFGVIASSWQVALAQIGAAIVFFGLAMLFEITIKPLGKGVGAFFRLLFRQSGHSSGTIAQAHWLRTFVVGLVFLLVGAAVGGFVFHEVGSDWHNLAVVGEVTQKEETIDLSDNYLEFTADNLKIEVLPLMDDVSAKEAKLVYTYISDLPMEYTAQRGSVALKNGNWSFSFWEYAKECWSRGILFSAVAADSSTATLYLPVVYSGGLNVKLNNGSLTFGRSDMRWVNSFGNLTLSADNGKIEVENVSAENLTVDTDNGYVALTSVTVLQEVKATTDNGAVQFTGLKAESLIASTQNGAIRCDWVDAAKLNLSASNGAINGTLMGREGNYKISVHVGNGSCNLRDRDSGERELTVKAGNGAINLAFLGN